MVSYVVRAVRKQNNQRKTPFHKEKSENFLNKNNNNHAETVIEFVNYSTVFGGYP